MKQYGLNFVQKTVLIQLKKMFKPFLLFLTFLLEQGLHYSAINTARSALSSLLGLNSDSDRIGEHNLIRRFLKEAFVQRPSLPRYITTWNADVVLLFLRSLSPLHEISLKLLSYKCVMLLALLMSQRIYTICKTLREDIRFNEDNCIILSPQCYKISPCNLQSC